MPAWSRLTVAELRAALEQRGLAIDGTKPVLVDRLQASEAAVKPNTEKRKPASQKEDLETEDQSPPGKKSRASSRKKTFAVIAEKQKEKASHPVQQPKPARSYKSSASKPTKVHAVQASTTASEMWIHICMFLEPDALAAIDAVSKFLHGLSRSDRVWIPHCSGGRSFYIASIQQCFQCEEKMGIDGIPDPSDSNRSSIVDGDILVVCQSCSGFFQELRVRDKISKTFPLTPQDVLDIPGSVGVSTKIVLKRVKEIYVSFDNAFPKTAPIPRLVKELFGWGYLLEEAPMGLRNSKVYHRFEEFDQKYAKMIKEYPKNGVTWKQIIATARKYIAQQREYDIKQALGQRQNCLETVLASPVAQGYLARGLRGKGPIVPGEKSVAWKTIDEMINEALETMKQDESSSQLLSKMKGPQFSFKVPGTSVIFGPDEFFPLFSASVTLERGASSTLEVARAEAGRLIELFTAVHAHLKTVKEDPAPPEQKDEIPFCSNCNVKMRKVVGKLGRFFGCPSFPHCRYTQECRPPRVHVQIDLSDPQILLEIARMKVSQSFIGGGTEFSSKLVTDLVSSFLSSKKKKMNAAAQEAFDKKSQALMKAKRTKRRKRNDSHDGIIRRDWRAEYYGR